MGIFQFTNVASSSGSRSRSMIKATGGIAPIASRRASMASYAVGRVAGSGSTSDTSTLSISGSGMVP